MDDEWDDSADVVQTPGAYDASVDKGRSVSAGRGFQSIKNNGFDDGGEMNGERRGPGGRGGRGGRGARGGRGGSRDFESYGGGGDDDSKDRGGRGRWRGRGGRGRGEDHHGENGDNREVELDQNGEPKKPPVTYVPPEPSNDEADVFNTNIQAGINFDKFDNTPIKVTGENPPEKITSFENANLRKYVLDNVLKADYKKPTPIQKCAIPIVIAGRDLMACAQTGSGKTAAFLIPIMHCLLQEPKDLVVGPGQFGCAEPQVLILSPTRELALQIYYEARKFAYGSVLKVCISYGGTSVRYQLDMIAKGCHILVATPGRLKDFFGRERISFASIRTVVLDEADRMLDMGFLPEIETIMQHPTMVPMGDRQTLMFSATFPEEIQHLAGRFLNNYLFVAIGIVGGASSDVEQIFHEVSKYEKQNALKKLVEENEKKRILIFVETKRNADFIAAMLSEQQWLASSIHGDRMQKEREEALANFKSGRHSLLVATAVAARGLDIANVDIVCNYDMPKSIDEYVHRIGRTGRVGNRGKAVSFFDADQDGGLSADLAKILKQADQTVPDFLQLGGTTSYKGNKYGGSDIRSFNNASAAENTGGQEEDEEW